MAESQQSTPRAPYAPEEPKPNLASNILAIVGFIILIVVVIWGLVNLASLSRGWFSSLFGGGEAVVSVTAPESAVAGAPFTLSWKYDEPAPGSYALLYQCASGLGFQTQGPAGPVGIPCGAAFTVANAEKRISLTPYLSGAEKNVALSIIFIPAATTTSSGEAVARAQGSATVKILPASSPTPTPTPTPSPAKTPTQTPAPTPKPAAPSVPTTPADLSVRIISVSIDAGGNGIATFDIANVGGSPSGTYYFSAHLPTVAGYTYSSLAQSSLAPQAHIVSTLRFTQGMSGIFSVSITTPDANSSNNYASQSVTAPYYNYNFNYPYQGQYVPVYQYQTPYGVLPMQTLPAQPYPLGQYPAYQYPTYQPYTQYAPYSTYYPYMY